MEGKWENNVGEGKEMLYNIHALESNEGEENSSVIIFDDYKVL